jgi:hypothetical protein
VSICSIYKKKLAVCTSSSVICGRGVSVSGSSIDFVLFGGVLAQVLGDSDTKSFERENFSLPLLRFLFVQ